MTKRRVDRNSEHTDIDPSKNREAMGRTCLARGGNDQVLISNAFWPEHRERCHAVREEILRTLQWRHYFADPRVDPRRQADRHRRALGSGRQPSSYHVMEISHGPFERIVPLPASVDPDGTKASVTNGMLEICMPKARPQRITIAIATTEAGDGR